MSSTPLCRRGGAYKKETCIWNPVGRTHRVCACKCHHFPDGPPTKGRGSHPYTVGERSSKALKGPGEITHRNRFPARLLRHLLTHITKGGWFLDLYSGYQADREIVTMLGLRYVAVDIEKTFKLGPGSAARVATADVVADLAVIDPEDLLSIIEEKLNLSPDDLAFIWVPPPCETHADMQNINRAKGAAAQPPPSNGTWTATGTHVKAPTGTCRGSMTS